MTDVSRNQDHLAGLAWEARRQSEVSPRVPGDTGSLDFLSSYAISAALQDVELPRLAPATRVDLTIRRELMDIQLGIDRIES